MITVKLSRNYTFPDFKRQTPGNTGVWEGMTFHEENVDEADFALILNQPVSDIRVKINKHGRWLILQEPPYDKKDFYKPYFQFADKIYSGYDERIQNNVQHQAALPWHINKSYDQLKALKHSDIVKSNRISWVTSSNNLYSGHQYRIDFIDYLKSEGFDFDLFGRGFQPIDDKYDGIAPYKYSIAVENYFAPDYWTEKAIDCILSWTIPIYFGCTNFESYFPKGAFIWLDIRNKEESLLKLKSILASNHWESNLHALEEARNLILDKYQIYPVVKKMVDDYLKLHPKPKKKVYFIPKSGATKIMQLKTKVKRLFGI